MSLEALSDEGRDEVPLREPEDPREPPLDRLTPPTTNPTVIPRTYFIFYPLGALLQIIGRLYPSSFEIEFWHLGNQN